MNKLKLIILIFEQLFEAYCISVYFSPSSFAIVER